MNALMKPVDYRIAGLATIEFAFVLGLLLMLSYPVYDFFRAIQTSMVLTNIAREGANLAARTSNPDYQDIMNKLAATAPPLKMGVDGMIYITVVKGVGNPVSNEVQEQYRWEDGPTGNYSPQIQTWNCASWKNDGGCNMPNPLPMTNNLPLSLAAGDVIYIVDVFYRQPSLFDYSSGLLTLGVFPEQFHARLIL